MKCNKTFFSIIFMLSICSCLKEVPYPGISVAPILNVNATFSPDEDFMVQVNKTVPSSQNGLIPFIDFARVNIFDQEDNLVKELEHQQYGLYFSEGFKPEENKTYKIEVSADDFTTVSSTNQSPKSFTSEVLDHSIVDFKNNKCIELDISINDNADENNFYIIEIENFVQLDSFRFESYYSPFIGHYSNDSNSEGIDNTENGSRGIYLPDDNFNGENYQMKIGFCDILLFGLTEENKANSFFSVSIKSVSRDYYLYSRAIEKSLINQNLDFSEPVYIHNNITNGVGLFAGYKENFKQINH